jgi:hypothetical protein
MADLLEWNRELEQTCDLRDYHAIEDLFLWGSDPFEKYDPEILYNRNHLLGVLVCRCLSFRYAKAHVSSVVPVVAPVTDESSDNNKHRFEIIRKPPQAMSLQEIKDTLSNMQFEWPLFLDRAKNDEAKIDIVKQYIQECMCRVGDFLNYTQNESVLDNIQDTVYECRGGFRKLTESATRRLLGSFLTLLRHIDLYDMSDELAPLSDVFETGVTKYHHEASMDHFHKLCMHYYLPVAAKLHFKHDFPGMYNDVSQAVYFHDVSYKRKVRGEFSSLFGLDMLPSICLLYPELGIKFEDDVFNPLDNSEGKWYFVVVPQRIYLVSPEPHVYYSKDFSVYVKIYLEFKNASRV